MKKIIPIVAFLLLIGALFLMMTTVLSGGWVDGIPILIPIMVTLAAALMLFHTVFLADPKPGQTSLFTMFTLVMVVGIVITVLWLIG